MYQCQVLACGPKCTAQTASSRCPFLAWGPGICARGCFWYAGQTREAEQKRRVCLVQPPWPALDRPAIKPKVCAPARARVHAPIAPGSDIPAAAGGALGLAGYLHAHPPPGSAIPRPYAWRRLRSSAPGCCMRSCLCMAHVDSRTRRQIRRLALLKSMVMPLESQDPNQGSWLSWWQA